MSAELQFHNGSGNGVEGTLTFTGEDDEQREAAIAVIISLMEAFEITNEEVRY